jgi:Rhodopirellula transposase DDE domain
MFSDQIKKTIKNAAKVLTGYKRRAFIAEVATDYFAGSARKTEREMGWSRDAIETGLGEIRTGIRCIDDYSARGNKRTETQLIGLKDSIRSIVEPHIQTDPDFKNPYSYLKITSKSVRNELINIGYTEAQLPSEKTIGNILNRMDYSLKRVQKKSRLKK